MYSESTARLDLYVEVTGRLLGFSLQCTVGLLRQERLELLGEKVSNSQKEVTHDNDRTPKHVLT